MRALVSSLLLSLSFAPPCFAEPVKKLPKIFSVSISSQTAAQLNLLSELDPSPEYRLFHGKWTKGGDGEFSSLPDPVGLQNFQAEHGLNPIDTDLLARFIATRDQIAQLQKEIAQAQTSYRAVLELADGPEKNSTIGKKEAFQKALNVRFEKKLPALVSTAIGDYDSLRNRLGETRCKKIFASLRSKSAAKFRNVVAEGEKQRAHQAARCRQGLVKCKFPKKLVENCAAYLDMSIDKLKKLCPKPGEQKEDR